MLRGMSLSTTERRALDHIEIMLLVRYPRLATTLDMNAVRRMTNHHSVVARVIKRLACLSIRP